MATGVKFDFDAEKSAAAIVFLAAQGIPDLTKGKICKLIFLADKHHLVRFGRTVSGDRICAMQNGPVPSAILNILNSILSGLSSLQGVSLNRAFRNPHFEAERFDRGDFLSESDLEALSSVSETYGKKTFSELWRLTHDMPAYKNAWADKPDSSNPMAFEDFFEEDDEALTGAFEEMIENFKLREAFPIAATA